MLEEIKQGAIQAIKFGPAMLVYNIVAFLVVVVFFGVALSLRSSVGVLLVVSGVFTVMRVRDNWALFGAALVDLMFVLALAWAFNFFGF